MAKTVHLIRHGESTFNALSRATGRDPMHFDAPLTQTGRRQAAGLREQVRNLGPELVVTSPFTRAIETTFAIGASAPVVVEALHRECLQSSCDVGRPPQALAARFPELRFDHLDDPWWHVDPGAAGPIHVEPEPVVVDRLAAFVDWLTARPERSIAVVGHGTFFFRMTGHFLDNGALHTIAL